MRLYGWLQLGSTVAGAVVVAAYCLRRLGRRPVRPRPPAVPRSGLWLVPVPLSALTVGVVSWDPWAAVGAALLALLAVATGWRAARQEQ